MGIDERKVLGDRYRLGPVLGRGGSSVVHEAYDLRLERPVAVKRLRVQALDDAELRVRFEREARAASRLAHPNIVEVFDAGESEGQPYLVMERLTGQSLADSLLQGPLGQEDVRLLASQLLGAVAAAHSEGILHRDIKPSNILWSRHGSIKVADFGIAKGMEHLSTGLPGDPTATNVLVGTPAYLAPERLEGMPATPSSDLWSVGVVLYEALTGVKPFAGSSALTVAYEVKHANPVPLGERIPGLDPALMRGIHRALEKAPDRRVATAAEMDALLRRCSADCPHHPGDDRRPDEYANTVPLPLSTRLAGRGRHRLGHMAGLGWARASGGWQLMSKGRKRPLLVGALVILGVLSVLGGFLLSSYPKEPTTAGRRVTPPATAPATTLPPLPPTTAPPSGDQSESVAQQPDSPVPKLPPTTHRSHHRDNTGDAGNDKRK